MTFEYLCRKVVESLNEENVPVNDYDKYVLEMWFEDTWKYRPLIYHHGGRCTDRGWGAVCFVRAGQGEEDMEVAYRKLFREILRWKYGVEMEFETYEELRLKLDLNGLGDLLED